MEMEMLVNEREMACEKTRSFELKFSKKMDYVKNVIKRRWKKSHQKSHLILTLLSCHT